MAQNKRYFKAAERRYTQPVFVPPLPPNVVLREDGTPMLHQDGTYVLRET